MNHFIEIQSGSDGFVWAMIHSGSRNVGWKVADHYMHVAKMLNERHSPPAVPPSWELETLPLDSVDGQAYLREMNWCLEFALLNRKVMMDLVRTSIVEAVPGTTFDREININHNTANLEEHGGEKLWVHRKGATPAFEGQMGLIPGAQGAHSYVVVGKGNPDSFMSCSHGAGRKMSRSKARKELDLVEEIRQLDEAGVVHSIETVEDLDEAKGAYKDVIQCLAYQTDLVDIDTELFTLGVLKGKGRRKKGKRSPKEADQDIEMGD